MLQCWLDCAISGRSLQEENEGFPRGVAGLIEDSEKGRFVCR